MHNNPPEIGDIVLYKLTAKDERAINEELLLRSGMAPSKVMETCVGAGEEVGMHVMIVNRPDEENLYDVGGQLLLECGVHHIVMQAHETMSSVTFLEGMWSQLPDGFKIPILHLLDPEDTNIIKFSEFTGLPDSDDFDVTMQRYNLNPDEFSPIDLFSNYKGIMLQVDEDGMVMDASLLTDLESTRSQFGNILIWFGEPDPETLAILKSRVPIKPFTDILTTTIITKATYE